MSRNPLLPRCFAYICLLGSLLCLSAWTSCAAQPPDPNRPLLDQVAADRGWFHAKKTRPIWALRAEEDHVLTTLEGEEAVAAGDYICRGAAGELWPQKEEKLFGKYEATGTFDEDGWQLYRPRPDAAGVMAAQVGYAFSVQATWGVLSGNAGDYVVKSFADRDTSYPEDVWIVDQALFNATYKRVEPDTPPSGQ